MNQDVLNINYVHYSKKMGTAKKSSQSSKKHGGFVTPPRMAKLPISGLAPNAPKILRFGGAALIVARLLARRPRNITAELAAAAPPPTTL